MSPVSEGAFCYQRVDQIHGKAEFDPVSHPAMVQQDLALVYRYWPRYLPRGKVAGAIQCQMTMMSAEKRLVTKWRFLEHPLPQSLVHPSGGLSLPVRRSSTDSVSMTRTTVRMSNKEENYIAHLFNNQHFKVHLSHGCFVSIDPSFM